MKNHKRGNDISAARHFLLKNVYGIVLCYEKVIFYEKHKRGSKMFAAGVFL